MKVFRGFPNATARAPCALTIGNFDGVHRGHQALLASVRQAATEMGLEAAVLTFEPHPREFFANLAHDPSKAPTRISNLRDKLQSLTNAGIDRVVVEHFNSHFASLTPKEFTENVLVQGLHVKWLMIGEDFRYGNKRAGDLEMLIRAGKEYGFHVEALPTLMSGNTRISSSAVRKALMDGDFGHAEELLGHHYAISGHVVHGKKLGRTIGFPTINLRVAHKHPALSGIFVVQVIGLDGTKAIPGVASIGIRPSVDDSGRVLLEVYLFDYSAMCYGEIVRVEFLQKIRAEEKFNDLSTLTDAIASDVAQARRYFEEIAKQPNDVPTGAIDRI